jgi:hypothetical protein
MSYIRKPGNLFALGPDRKVAVLESEILASFFTLTNPSQVDTTLRSKRVGFRFHVGQSAVG